MCGFVCFCFVLFIFVVCLWGFLVGFCKVKIKFNECFMSWDTAGVLYCMYIIT